MSCVLYLNISIPANDTYGKDTNIRLAFTRLVFFCFPVSTRFLEFLCLFPEYLPWVFGSFFRIFEEAVIRRMECRFAVLALLLPFFWDLFWTSFSFPFGLLWGLKSLHYPPAYDNIYGPFLLSTFSFRTLSPKKLVSEDLDVYGLDRWGDAHGQSTFGVDLARRKSLPEWAPWRYTECGYLPHMAIEIKAVCLVLGFNDSGRYTISLDKRLTARHLRGRVSQISSGEATVNAAMIVFLQSPSFPSWARHWYPGKQYGPLLCPTFPDGHSGAANYSTQGSSWGQKKEAFAWKKCATPAKLSWAMRMA